MNILEHVTANLEQMGTLLASYPLESGLGAVGLLLVILGNVVLHRKGPVARKSDASQTTQPQVSRETVKPPPAQKVESPAHSEPEVRTAPQPSFEQPVAGSVPAPSVEVTPEPQAAKPELEEPEAASPQPEPPPVTVEQQQPPEPVQTPRPEPVQTPKVSVFERLRSGLQKTRQHFASGLQSIFSGGKLDEEVLERLHETLFRADLGVETVDRLTDSVRERLKDEDKASWEDVSAVLREEMEKIVSDVCPPKGSSEVPSPAGPRVTLVVGVNGAGKTTSIGKLTSKFKASGKSVLLCAGDTYRAAAIEQLQTWGKRTDTPVIAQKQGADPAAVAFDAMEAAKARGVSELIVDTAGRLQNHANLMTELSKIKRVLQKSDATAPHDVLLVVDATSGQNVFSQVREFTKAVDLTGLIVTKLDGTAKGGVVVGVMQQFKIPVKHIGVGEQAEDLQDFNASKFVESLI